MATNDPVANDDDLSGKPLSLRDVLPALASQILCSVALESPTTVLVPPVPLTQELLRASGSIGVFLLGMVLMTEGLKQLAGGALRDLLAHCVQRPIHGVLTGAAVTVAMQASSSTVLATMGFATAGMITLQQAVTIVAGATIGTTSTSWLMATVGLNASISVFAGPLVLIGALARMLRRGRTAQIGLLIAGFGMIIVGISSLKGSLGGVLASIPFAAIDTTTVGGTLMLVAIGGSLAVLMQSSAAPMAVAMAALADGSLSFPQAAPLVVGASVGTTSTALLALAGVGPPGRRVAMVWIIVSLIAAVLALVLLPFLESTSFGLTRFLDPSSPIALAAFHSTFAVLGATVSVLLAGPIAARLDRAIPDRGPRLTANLDPSLAGVPAIALEAARRSLAATASEALRAAESQLRDGSHAGSERLAMIKNAEAAIEHFISSVHRDALGSRDAERVVACLQAIGHISEVRRLLKRHELRPPIEEPQPSRALRERAIDLTEAVIDWLEDDGTSPLEQAEVLSMTVSAQRPEIRSGLLQRTADGRLAPEIADAGIDAIRAIDEFGRELHRLVANLDLTRRGPLPPRD